MKYSEGNIATVLKKIKNLEKDFGVKPADAFSFLTRKIDQYNAENPQEFIKPIGKTTFYQRLKTPVNLTKIFSEKPFRILIKFLDTKGFDVDTDDDVLASTMHMALSQFANISKHNDEHGKGLLPGYYRTYRPSLGKPGYAVAGLLHVFQDPESGALETFETMAYQPKREGRKSPKHTFKGMAWFSRGHYFLLTTDSNTKFVQSIMLRSLYSDEGEEHLEGLYMTITNKGGKSMICSKIVVQRLHCDPNSGSAWIKVLRDTIGYKHPEHENPRCRIKRSVWDRIDPENAENLIRI